MTKVNCNSDKLRDDLIKLFSSENIFYNCSTNLILEYEKFFNNEFIQLLFKEEDLINTATLFFKNNLNIASASKCGFMHRNTLIYRLDKIEKLIGLDIRNFEDAVVFQNMLLFNTMIKQGLY